MKAETFIDAINDVEAEHISSAGRFLGLIGRDGKRSPGGVKRRLRTLLIAAVLAALMSVPAFAAVDYMLNSPEQAVKQANEELRRLNELGIIEAEIQLEYDDCQIMKLEGQDLGRSFFYRRIRPNYNISYSDGKYSFVGQIDMANGRLVFWSLKAYAGEDEEPIESFEQTLPGGETIIHNYYDNTHKLVSPELTVDGICSALAEYWGFEGYTLAGTVNGDYGWDTPAPEGDSLVKDICDGPYLTVYFEGDQSGVPMYVEICRVSGGTVLCIGTNHLIG